MAHELAGGRHHLADGHPPPSKAIRDTGLPKVELLYNEPTGVDVGCDHNAIGRMAAEHFLDRGLRHFAFFTFGDAIWIRLRQEAFVRVLASPGYTCHLYEPPAVRQVAVPHWEESQQVHVVEWISSLPRPLGILCASDLHALPVLKACRELRIPDPRASRRPWSR